MSTYKPHMVVLAIQFAYAGLNITSKAALSNGMSHFVFVVYRHVIATVFLSPLAYFLERNGRPSLTFYIFCRIFILALCGITISQNLYFPGLNYTSATLASALSNGIPAMTFILAVMFRLEKFSIKSLPGQAKVFGTAVCIGGSVIVSLYKGPVIPIPWSPRGHLQGPHISPGDTAALNKDWIKGCVLIVIANITWSAWIVQQDIVAKLYPARLSMTALMCFLATLQSALIALIFERNAAQWTLKWDSQLLSVVYAGVMISGAVYYMQIWCMSKKGPVFVAMFSPVSLIAVSVLSFFIFSERLHLGIAVGGILVVTGLYTMLWGKKKDVQAEMSKMLPLTSSNDSGSAPIKSMPELKIGTSRSMGSLS